MLVDPEPLVPGDSLGLVLTLDRKGKYSQKEDGIVVHQYRIFPNPDGGESMIGSGLSGGRFGDAISAGEGRGSVDLLVSARHFEDFHDAALVTMLWEAVRKDGRNALRGLYEQLYAIYGPGAGACIACDGLLVCSTRIKSCGEVSNLH